MNFDQTKEVHIPQLCHIFVDSDCFVEDSDDEDDLFSSIDQDKEDSKYVLAIQNKTDDGDDDDDDRQNLICKVFNPEKLIANEGNNRTEQSWYKQLMLIREVIFLKELHHPAIVDFKGFNLFNRYIRYAEFDHDLDYTNPTLFLEYLSNKSLQNVIENSLDDLNLVKRQICMIGITAAVYYFHRKFIIHRNLNPKTIWLDENYYPKIFDFSKSREFNKSKKGCAFTPISIDLISYQPPEIMDNLPIFHPSADIFSLGRLLYFFITGYEPFTIRADPLRKCNLYDLEKKIKQEEFPYFPDTVPLELQTLIKKCWRFNPSERPLAKEIYYNLIWNENCRIVEFNDEIRSYIDIIDNFERNVRFSKLQIIPTFDAYIDIPESTIISSSSDLTIPKNPPEQINMLLNIISANFAESNEENILDLLLLMADNGSILTENYLQKVINYVNSLSDKGNKKANNFLVKIFGDYIADQLKSTQIVSGSIPSNLTTINVPASVKNIGKMAFASLKNLRRVNLPNTVSKIDDMAFKDCVELVTVNIPESVKNDNLGMAVFENCKSLMFIKLPSNLKILKDDTFKNDIKLSEVVLNNDLKVVGKNAFYGCESLVYIEIPSKVNLLESKAFANCRKLSVVYFHGKKPKLEEYALSWLVKQLP